MVLPSLPASIIDARTGMLLILASNSTTDRLPMITSIFFVSLRITFDRSSEKKTFTGRSSSFLGTCPACRTGVAWPFTQGQESGRASGSMTTTVKGSRSSARPTAIGPDRTTSDRQAVKNRFISVDAPQRGGFLRIVALGLPGEDVNRSFVAVEHEEAVFGRIVFRRHPHAARSPGGDQNDAQTCRPC